MPAHEQNFPWPSYYGHYKFFEGRMNAHSKVGKIGTLGKGRYDITLNNGDVLKVFICECYSYGIAEYIETIDKLGPLNAIIINSNWCGYTLETKRHCRDEKVGVFTIAGFMAALNRPDYWVFLDEFEKEKFKENGWR